VGTSVLSLVLDGEDVHLDRLLSRQGVETITQTALAVLGEHPEILSLSKNTGLQKLLSAIAAELSQYDTLLTPDVLPELTRLILVKTGENLALLWPDLADNPQRHLLLTAARTTLDILTRKPDNGQQWTLRFSSADLLAVASTVLDELAANPTWLLDQAGQINDNLQIALDAALSVLRNRADKRLSPATAVAVLRAVVEKVGRRKEFLDLMPAGTAWAGKPLFSAVLDTIFSTVFDAHINARAAWQVVRSETILAFVNISLTQLAKVPLSPEKVTAFAAFVTQRMALLTAGASWDILDFEAQLQAALAA
jgi:hypothetical protein